MRTIAGAVRPPHGTYDADIIILAQDRPQETEAAIRSALEQGGVTRHVTIVDQGSRPEALERLAACVRGRPDATLLGLTRNIGVPAGRNRASAFGHGRVIIGLDNDAVFKDAGTAAAAVAALDTTADLAAIGFRILLQETGQDDLRSWGYPRSLLGRAGERFEAATFVGAGHALRRAAWERLGGYDETLFFAWEEADLCRRAIAVGWRVEYRGDVAIRHMIAADRRVEWASGRWLHFVRNRLFLAQKHGAGRLEMAALATGFALKGTRNGLLLQTAQGAFAAWSRARQMVSKGTGGAPDLGRRYMLRADAAHRPPMWRRLRSEVLARLPG